MGSRRETKKLSELLNTDELYILFGGPSLKHFDLSRLDNKPTLACNKCAEVYAADAIISIDATYIGTKRHFLKEYQGYVILGHRETKPHPEYGMPRAEWIDPSYLFWHERSVKMSEKENLLYGLNTGHAAVNFAMLHGFKTLHCLGLDMAQGGHWHSGYSHSSNQQWMTQWAKQLDDCKNVLDAWDVRLINYNPDSGVRAYEFGDLRSI